MILLAISTACAGTFFGAAVYINLVEHPARMACGQELALREFGPSYARASVMQGGLAVAGCLTGLAAAWLLRDGGVLGAAVLLGLILPFTLIVIFPTNKQLSAPSLDSTSEAAAGLLARWNRLHAVRGILSGLAFVLLLYRLVSGGAV